MPRPKTSAVRPVHVNSARMQYVELGDPDGTPVLFVRGKSGSWRSFAELVRHLPSGIRAIAPDPRGAADADQPERARDAARMTAGIIGFLDAAAIARAVLVGHAMGATVAQRVAIDQPDRVIALVLIGAWPPTGGHGDAAPQRQGVYDEDRAVSLHDIAVPTLLVWGDRDHLSPREAQDALLEAIPRARLRIYRNTGHAVHCEQPARLALDIAAFLSDTT